ncbi:MAG: helix-turn-helix domain-containing protein [Synergistaceae bacterium]|nr:helix-turn-helix domain-containing protein [Synergistaceae bacterium]
MDIQEFISVEEAAELSGYGKWNITLLCRQGKLDGAVKVGKVWLIPRKAIEDYKPGPQGFAAVWAHRRAAQNAESAGHDNANRSSSGQESAQDDTDAQDIQRELLKHIKILLRKMDRLEKLGEKIIAAGATKSNAQPRSPAELSRNSR